MTRVVCLTAGPVATSHRGAAQGARAAETRIAATTIDPTTNHSRLSVAVERCHSDRAEALSRGRRDHRLRLRRRWAGRDAFAGGSGRRRGIRRTAPDGLCDVEGPRDADMSRFEFDQPRYRRRVGLDVGFRTVRPGAQVVQFAFGVRRARASVCAQMTRSPSLMRRAIHPRLQRTPARRAFTMNAGQSRMLTTLERLTGLTDDILSHRNHSNRSGSPAGRRRVRKSLHDHHLVVRRLRAKRFKQ